MMNKLLHLIFYFHFILLISVPLTHSQTISTPWSWGIVSDFGPRTYNGWDFHEGIDYSAAPYDDDLGTPNPAVEGENLIFLTIGGLK